MSALKGGRERASIAAMPLINIYTSAEPPSDVAKTDALLKDLSARLARHLCKPEAYVMTCLVPRTRMTFGGSTDPACFVEIKNVGRFSPEVTANMSHDLCEVLKGALGVPANRIYIEFGPAEPHLWGYDGDTFA
jgi:phenylpyruvate tautomerase